MSGSTLRWNAKTKLLKWLFGKKELTFSEQEKIRPRFITFNNWELFWTTSHVADTNAIESTQIQYNKRLDYIIFQSRNQLV